MESSRTEGENISTLRWWSIAATRAESLNEIDGEFENRRRKYFYFAMMICCCYQSRILKRNWWTGREQKEKLSLLSDDDPLLMMDLRPSRKLMDRSRTEGENVSTLRWWFVAADGSPSFKEIDGQVENRRRKCLYFPMMISCCKQMLVLQKCSP